LVLRLVNCLCAFRMPIDEINIDNTGDFVEPCNTSSEKRR
jgi:hypothetical protein